MVCRLGPPMLGAASGLAIWLADGMARVCAVHSVPLYQRTSRGFAGSGYQPGEVVVVTRASHQTKWWTASRDKCGPGAYQILPGSRAFSWPPVHNEKFVGSDDRTERSSSEFFAPANTFAQWIPHKRSYPARHGSPSPFEYRGDLFVAHVTTSGSGDGIPQVKDIAAINMSTGGYWNITFPSHGELTDDATAILGLGLSRGA